MLRWRIFGDAHPPASSHAVVVALDEKPSGGLRSKAVRASPGRPRSAGCCPRGHRRRRQGRGFRHRIPDLDEQSAVPFGDETLGARLRGFDRDYLRAGARRARRQGRSARFSTRTIRSCRRPASAPRSVWSQYSGLNVYSDPDGVIRRVPLEFTVDGEPVPDGGGVRRARRRCTGGREGRGCGLRGRHDHAQLCRRCRRHTDLLARRSARLRREGRHGSSAAISTARFGDRHFSTSRTAR